MPPFGKTFAPTEDAQAEARQQEGMVGRRSQSAVSVRNLSYPTTIGPGAPAADFLLQPKPQITPEQISPDKAVLASIVRALIGSSATLPETDDLTVPSDAAAPTWFGGSPAAVQSSQQPVTTSVKAPTIKFGIEDPRQGGGIPEGPLGPTGPFGPAPPQAPLRPEGPFTPDVQSPYPDVSGSYGMQRGWW